MLINNLEIKFALFFVCWLLRSCKFGSLLNSHFILSPGYSLFITLAQWFSSSLHSWKWLYFQFPQSNIRFFFLSNSLWKSHSAYFVITPPKRDFILFLSLVVIHKLNSPEPFIHPWIKCHRKQRWNRVTLQTNCARAIFWPLVRVYHSKFDVVYMPRITK